MARTLLTGQSHPQVAGTDRKLLFKGAVLPSLRPARRWPEAVGRPDATQDYLFVPGLAGGVLGCSAPLAGCSLALGVAGAGVDAALIGSLLAGAAGFAAAGFAAAGFAAGLGCSLAAGVAVRAAGLAEVAELLFMVLERIGVIGLLAVTVRGVVLCSVATLRPPVAFPQPLSARLSAKGANAHFHIFIAFSFSDTCLFSKVGRPCERLTCAGTIPACRHTGDATLVPSPGGGNRMHRAFCACGRKLQEPSRGGAK